MKDFPRLNSAVLSFHHAFSSEDPESLYYGEVPQPSEFRFKAMGLLFSLLGSLQSPVQDLGIRNLQVQNSNDPETLKNMEKVLSSLQSLRLSIVSETNDAVPEHDLEVKPYDPDSIGFFLTSPVSRNSPVLQRTSQDVAQSHHFIAPASITLFP